MGNTKSTQRAPNNPMEVEQRKREQRKKIEKQQKKALKEKLKLEKKNRNRQKKGQNTNSSHNKLANVAQPIAPHVPKKIEADYDLEAKKRMQEQLAHDSQTFILNQLMLSIQFYGNYEKEMWEAATRNRKQENEITRKIEKHCKIVILPDRLYEAIDRRVKFQFRHGQRKTNTSSLHTQTLYIIHENIEITNPGEPFIYSILTEAPIYKMEIDIPPIKQKKSSYNIGYIRLKSSEIIRKKYDSFGSVGGGGGQSSSATDYNNIINNNNNNNNHRNSNNSYGINSNMYGLSEYSNESNHSIKNTSNNVDDDDDDDEDEVSLRDVSKKHKDSILILSNNNSNNNYRKINQRISNNVNLTTTISSNSTTSAPSSDSSEYDYAYITALNTRQPLSNIIQTSSSATGGGSVQHQLSEILSTIKLPDGCITDISTPSQSTLSDDDDDDEDADGDDDDREQSYEIKQYLNSKTFLAYFLNIFHRYLAFELGITREELLESTWKGCVIYSSCWEIIPAISCPWPKEAFEWMHRQREVRENPLTRQKFQWPTPAMVNKVVQFGCHVIPFGYAPKNGINPKRELEWKIVFPEAERYLESCLTSTQTKVYVITKTLIKTFVEPHFDNKINMFTTEHLRVHLFWQCENNYAAWPEDYLGEALIRFLNSLLQHIKVQKLPDYFLPKRNLFENIPEKVLVELHKRIYRITENPVMYLLIAMKNLRFQSATLYPHLDLKKIYGTIIIDNPLKILNPKFLTKNDSRKIGTDIDLDDNDDDDVDDEDEEGADNNGGGGGAGGRNANHNKLRITKKNILKKVVKSGGGDDDDDDYDGPMGAMGYFELAEKTNASKRKRTKRVQFAEAEKIRQEIEKNRQSKRSSTESFDIKFPVKKHMEQIRRTILYETFIEHYIEMAKASFSFKSFNQAIIYLNQAKRLCNLSKDDGREMRLFDIEIDKLLIEVITERNRESQTKPHLPLRESMMEPVKQVRIRNPLTKSKDDYDPYTNIEAIKTPSFSSDPMDSNGINNKYRQKANAFGLKINVNSSSERLTSSASVSPVSLREKSPNQTEQQQKPTNRTSAATTGISLNSRTPRKKSVKNTKQHMHVITDIQIHTPPTERTIQQSPKSVLKSPKSTTSKLALSLQRTSLSSTTTTTTNGIAKGKKFEKNSTSSTPSINSIQFFDDINNDVNYMNDNKTKTNNNNDNNTTIDINNPIKNTTKLTNGYHSNSDIDDDHRLPNSKQIDHLINGPNNNNNNDFDLENVESLNGHEDLSTSL